jgi:hypothetical protein
LHPSSRISPTAPQAALRLALALDPLHLTLHELAEPVAVH